MKHGIQAAAKPAADFSGAVEKSPVFRPYQQQQQSQRCPIEQALKEQQQRDQQPQL